MNFSELIYEPWPWYVAGPIIAAIMFLLIYFGKDFGMSYNLKTLCAAAGADRASDFFRFEWQKYKWNLMVVLGAILGGFISSNFLTKDPSVDISEGTKATLVQDLGFDPSAAAYLPSEIFGVEALTSPTGIFILLLGGFLVGFGSRYAGGCTSGHAISGLSNLQLPSLKATIGFFIGGLIMTHLIMPFIF
ncbi:MAG: YeeE/YedE family protein [Bacteroidia bacterium]|nr:YeeE/YedE family protein [Bacteroidia bacterium]